MSSKLFDYAVIGAGAAGLQLALAMMDDPFFKGKEIAIIEKELKDHADKTWCFWEIGKGKWDDIIDYSWQKGSFVASDVDLVLSLAPYRYKKLPSQKFYRFCKSRLNQSEQITWINDEVRDLEIDEFVTLKGLRSQYRANHVFDSRIDPSFFTDHSYKKVWQHFKGWEIETEHDVFDPETFVMMDFRIKHNTSTSFTYVLPTSKRRALVEFTFFTPYFVEEEVYDALLEEYIEQILLIDQFQIVGIEKGVIPMSDFPFHKNHLPRVTKIGTAGGWVKPSSGYSFKNAERYVNQMIDNLKNSRMVDQGIALNRHRNYDALFLDLLQYKNEMGEALFSSMYRKNSIQQVFRFLDEQSSLGADLSLMSTFTAWPFMKAILHRMKMRIFG